MIVDTSALYEDYTTEKTVLFALISVLAGTNPSDLSSSEPAEQAYMCTVHPHWSVRTWRLYLATKNPQARACTGGPYARRFAVI